MKYLIENGADIEAKDTDGLTALRIASENYYKGNIQLIVKRQIFN